MKTSIIFILSGIGILVGLYSAFAYSRRPPAQPPAFTPAANPYERGIYANGIIESSQPNGSNINIYPDISGPNRLRSYASLRAKPFIKEIRC